MKRARTLRVAALGIAAASGLGGCASGSANSANGHQAPTGSGLHKVAAGRTEVLTSPSQDASLRITVGRPTRSSRRLSKDYGYAPRFGRYVTFRLAISNTGKVPIEIQRLDFWVRTPGAPKTTTDDGNAPFSGSASQLDTTELSPGQAVANDLTFDVAHPSGTLFYAPGGHRALAWTF